MGTSMISFGHSLNFLNFITVEIMVYI